MAAYRSFVRRFVVAALAIVAFGAVGAGGRTATAAAPPLAIKLGVTPGGTRATVYVRPTNADLITVSHTLRVVTNGGISVPPSRIPLHDLAVPLVGAVATTGGTPPAPTYEKEATIHLGNLHPNTTYEVVVTASTPGGETATARATFTTLKQRVRLTLDKIVVHNDGDGFLAGKGEPTWLWTVDGFAGGPLSDCYPKNAAGRCGVAEVGEGTVLPRTASGQPFRYVFAEENFQPIVNPNPQPGGEDFSTMPRAFTLHATAKEDDSIIGPLDAALSTLFGDWGAQLLAAPVATWQVPQGVESASRQVTVGANDGTFESTMYFTFELFYDAASYPPNVGRVHATSW